MSSFTVTLPGGKVWVPKFVASIDQEKCIGCGRCFQVCGCRVLEMVGIGEDGDEEYDRKVMSIAHAENCVGCEACAKICPKKCYTHVAMAA